MFEKHHEYANVVWFCLWSNIKEIKLVCITASSLYLDLDIWIHTRNLSKLVDGTWCQMIFNSSEWLKCSVSVVSHFLCLCLLALLILYSLPFPQLPVVCRWDKRDGKIHSNPSTPVLLSTHPSIHQYSHTVLSSWFFQFSKWIEWHHYTVFSFSCHSTVEEHDCMCWSEHALSHQSML